MKPANMAAGAGGYQQSRGMHRSAQLLNQYMDRRRHHFAAERCTQSRSTAVYTEGLDTSEATCSKPPPLPADAETSDQWSLVAWLQGAGVHRAVALAIQQSVGPQGIGRPEAPLAFLRQLKDRAALASVLNNGAMLEAVIDLVWEQVEALQRAGAATSGELQGKFAGSIELSYSGLDTFFSGLEGVLGSPDPKLMEAMAAEHTQRGDSTDTFVTGNYGVETTSKVEWMFVVAPDAAAERAGVARWPVESEAKLPDRNKCRVRQPLNKLLTGPRRKERDKMLRAANQPTLLDEEVVAASLYTGPLFVKYNGVLRGLQSDSPFLHNTMIQLCCPRDVFVKYIGSVPLTKLFLKVDDGAISFEEAVRSLNRYTTTIHGINSAIIKLGKLTYATKIYRGIAGMKLPDEFWEANDFGVKGGVEGAFMSTTTKREVAMGYAAGDQSRMGIVIEVQQGMVSRGAEISWLSQYPHEREILFGPLTGIEVLRTRIDSSVVVIECAFSINLTAMTLEQVLGKRKKLVEQMADLLRSDTDKHLVAGDAGSTGHTADANEAIRSTAQEWYGAICGREASAFNKDSVFGKAVSEALDAKAALSGTSAGLLELARHLDASAAEHAFELEIAGTNFTIHPLGGNAKQDTPMIPHPGGQHSSTLIGGAPAAAKAAEEAAAAMAAASTAGEAAGSGASAARKAAEEAAKAAGKAAAESLRIALCTEPSADGHSFLLRSAATRSYVHPFGGSHDGSGETMLVFHSSRRDPERLELKFVDVGGPDLSCEIEHRSSGCRIGVAGGRVERERMLVLRPRGEAGVRFYLRGAHGYLHAASLLARPTGDAQVAALLEQEALDVSASKVRFSLTNRSAWESGVAMVGVLSSRLRTLCLREQPGARVLLCLQFLSAAAKTRTLGLQELDVRRCDGLPRHAADTLADLLQHARLTTLDASENIDLQSNGCQAIARSLASDGCCCRELRLERIAAGAGGACAIANVLRTSSTVTALYMDDTFGAKGAELFTCLADNTSLQTLCIQGGAMGHNGGVALAAALPRNNRITKLVARANGFGDSLQEVAHALGKNTGLTELDLGYNGINAVGMAALAAALPKHPKLLKLLACGHTVADDVVAALEAAAGGLGRDFYLEARRR